MSLQVWFPLIKDTKNQGLCGDNIITSGVVFSDGGKLGAKYLSAGTVTIPSSISKEIFNKTGMSFAFWLYPIGTSGSATIMGQSSMAVGNNRMYTIYQYPTPNDLHLSWQDETSSSAFLGGVWTGFFPADTWTHCCVTYDGEKASIYKNGTLFTTISGVSNRGNFEYDFPITGSSIRKLNDFRIYDHALSPMEVKRISQGLVLHYRLSGVGGENLITTNSMAPISGTNGWSRAGNGWTNSNVVSEGASSGHAIRCTFNGESVVSGGFHHPTGIDKSELINGEIYTISARIRASKPCVATFYNELMPGNTINLTTDWKTYSYSHAIDNTRTYHSNVIYMRQADVTQNAWMECDWIKLEKGSTATPWIPNPSDTKYHTMGLDDNVEYDCSGFGNNGTKTGTIASDIDTARYITSYYFNGSSYISSASASFSWFNFDCGTLSAWIKPTVSISGWSGSIGIQADDSQYFKSFCLTDFDNQFRVTTTNGSWTTLSSGKTIPLNEWTHIAATLDGTTLKMYFNGELVSTQTVTWNSATVSGVTKFAVAVDLPGGDEKFTGNVSDVRFYSTVLSPSDILALYNLGGSIDNNGVFHTYEYVEV